MIANDYAIIERAVEEGVETAVRRHNKHRDTHEEISGALKDRIIDDVMSAISEVYFFSQTSERPVDSAL